MTAAGSVASFREATVRFTADEFMGLVRHPPLAERAGKIERVESEIVHMAPADIPRRRVRHDVMSKLRSAFAVEGEWLVAVEPTVRFAERGVRPPDLAVFRSPDLHFPIFEAADLFPAVEVADTSPGADLGPKRETYSAAAVPHYRVIDLKARSVVVMADPDGGRHVSSSRHAFGAPPPVPGTDAAIVID